MHGWTYDFIGNRLTNTVNGVPQTYSYFKNGSNPLNGQRLSSDGINAYTYDANGNTITRNGSLGNFTFGWDTDDRMISISGAATASYSYDYQGRRTSKTVSGATINYLYDGLNLIHTSGSTPADYLFGPGIDEPLASVQAGNVAYFSIDGLGSAHLLTGATGTVDNAYLYDGWGVIKSQAGTLANDFGYTAREFGEANLWYYRARYYQAGIGRFLSSDQNPPGGNVSYLYGRNGPVGHTDPRGRDAVDVTKSCCDKGISVTSAAAEACSPGNIAKLPADKQACMMNTCKNLTVKCGGPICWLATAVGSELYGYHHKLGGSTIHLCDAAFESPCQLRNTIFHEALHNCRYTDEADEAEVQTNAVLGPCP